jgi:hypothetical protein
MEKGLEIKYFNKFTVTALLQFPMPLWNAVKCRDVYYIPA